MAVQRPKKLSRAFYNRPTLQVAKDLIGKHIVYESRGGRMSSRIVEVEAYIGQDDPACHAARGRTARNEVMFGRPGVAYIYFIYGMYYCLNFVTEREGFPAAVLLRAAEPRDGIELMAHNSPHSRKHHLLSGPGKFCRSYGLTRKQNGLDMTGNMLYIEDHNEPAKEIGVSKRIGINSGAELPWRFFDAHSESLSKPGKSSGRPKRARKAAYKS
jgi:DNA-3-methyladenine glycosylase